MRAVERCVTSRVSDPSFHHGPRSSFEEVAPSKTKESPSPERKSRQARQAAGHGHHASAMPWAGRREQAAVVAHWSIERPHPLASVSVMIPAILDRTPVRVFPRTPTTLPTTSTAKLSQRPRTVDRVTRSSRARSIQHRPSPVERARAGCVTGPGGDVPGHPKLGYSSGSRHASGLTGQWSY